MQDFVLEVPRFLERHSCAKRLRLEQQAFRVGLEISFEIFRSQELEAPTWAGRLCGIRRL